MLMNPLAADLRRSAGDRRCRLVKKTAISNAARRAVNFRYFEIDKIFSRSAQGPEERWAFGILLGGALNDADWSTRRDCIRPIWHSRIRARMRCTCQLRDSVFERDRSKVMRPEPRRRFQPVVRRSASSGRSRPTCLRRSEFINRFSRPKFSSSGWWKDHERPRFSRYSRRFPARLQASFTRVAAHPTRRLEQAIRTSGGSATQSGKSAPTWSAGKVESRPTGGVSVSMVFPACCRPHAFLGRSQCGSGSGHGAVIAKPPRSSEAGN